MFDKINKTELFQRLSDCANIVVCDDHYLIDEIRRAFPHLYVKPLSLVREGQLTSALYVLMSEKNVRANTSALVIENEVVEENVDAGTAIFLDGIDFEPTTIETVETLETEFPVEETIGEIEEIDPCKPYEDMEFDSLTALADALSPEMQIVAREDMIEELREKRPDISVSPIEKGGISHTEGSIVLLRIRSKLCRKEVRKVYPPTATLYTVYC